MRLILVRHGETEANVNRVLQGHLDNPLSDRGRAQAECLARRLAKEPVDACYSSDLTRALETADIISRKLGIPVQTKTELRERSYGEFEGRPVTEYEKALIASGVARENYLPPGGEMLTDVEKRAALFLAELRDLRKKNTILAVAHSGINRALIKLLLNRSFDDWLAIDQQNACVNIFEISEHGSVSTIIMNCILHLESTGHSNVSAYE